MANQPWLDRARDRLVRQRLPPSYIQRFVEELTDHLNDFKEENMESDATSRMGEPEQVADNAVAAYRRRSFLGRHPVAAFFLYAISPSFVVVTSAVALFLISAIGSRCTGTEGMLFGCINPDGSYSIPGPFALATMPTVMTLLTIVLPSVLVCILYCKSVDWLYVGWKWIILPCVIVAAWAMVPCYFVDLTGSGGYKGVHAAIWIPVLAPFPPFDSVWQLVQPLIPLAICWWFMRRKQDQGGVQLAS
jgi:hypothetical protein